MIRLILILTLAGIVNANMEQREENWPSRFLENGKIPDNVARAEINSTIASVVGQNKENKNLSSYESGLAELEERYEAMSAAKAKDLYLRKLEYFLVNQYALVARYGGDLGEARERSMVDLYLSLESYSYNQYEAAKNVVNNFHKGLESLKAKVRYVALETYRARKMELSKVQTHDGYAGQLAANTTTVSGPAGQCGSSNFNRSDCYACASYTVAKALRNGFGESDPWQDSNVNQRLNAPPYASQFHKGWKEEQDRTKFRLTQAFSARDASGAEIQNGMKAALAAPKGSVLIWSICSGHPAGHIAIKTSATVAASSFAAPIQNTCSHSRAQIIGVYAPVNDKKDVDWSAMDGSDRNEISADYNQGNEAQIEGESMEIAQSENVGGFFEGLITE